MTPIVKEKIFEKFKEDSDPIKDLDIGYLIVKIPCRATYHGKEDGKDNWSWSAESMDFHFGQYLPKYIKEYDINFEPLPPKTIDSRDGSLKISGIRKNVLEFVKKLYKLNDSQLQRVVQRYAINESLNEKFSEEGDPISDMNIGLKGIIIKWLEKMEIKNWELNDDLSIDVYGPVDLSKKLNGNLPKYIKFNVIHNENIYNRVTGYFLCDHNNMTSLRGCPEKIDWYFSCSYNKLKSLKYAPKQTTHFYCHDNAKKFTVKDVLSRCKVRNTIFIDDGGKMYSWDGDHDKWPLDEKFSEEGDPIHDMGIGPQGIVYRCGECGDILDDNYNALSDDEKFEYAKAIMNAFGENSDRVKYVWCNRCREEELYRQEQEDYAREQERERERYEEDQRWHNENEPNYY